MSEHIVSRYSSDFRYRYYLAAPALGNGNGDDYAKGPLLWILLNPSEVELGPTVIKCRKIAERHGFDGIRVVNLYAYVATDPHVLRPLDAATRVGPENWTELTRRIAQADDIVAAWGNAAVGGRLEAMQVVAMLHARAKDGARIYRLGENKSGTPVHPAHVALKSKLERWAL